MGLESPSHWLIVALVVLVLFGYKKLPEMSRSVGRSLRIFKTEMKGMGEDDSVRDSSTDQSQPQAPWTAPAVPAVPPATEVPPSATAPAVPPIVVVPPVVVPPPAAAAEAPQEAPQQQTQG